MLSPEVERFINSGSTNEWLKVGHLEVYVRVSHRLSPNHRKLIRCFDIANVSCETKACGIFTEFLTSLNELSEYGFQAIFVEQVMTNRFADFFRKRNWIEVNQDTPIPSFYYFIGDKNV